jgi:tetratricopeptide (TPR) repeat protein
MNRILTSLLILVLLGCGGVVTAQKKDKKGKKGTMKAAVADPKIKERIGYLFIEAKTLYLQDDKEGAIRLFRELITIDPKNHAALYEIGKLQNELQNYHEGAKYCRMAVDLDPGNYWYHVELVNSWQGARDIGKALEAQAALAERFPGDKNALYDLAQLYIVNKDFQKAIETYAQLEKITGPNDEIDFSKHQLYVYTNQTEKAMVEIDSLIAANPNESRYYQAKHDLLMMMHKPEEALTVLENLLARNPKDAFALLSLADYYKAKGNMAKSDEYLERVFVNPEVDLEAKVKILAGMYASAETDPSILARMDHLSHLLQSQHPKSAMVMAIRGDVFQTAEKPDSARVCYRKSLQIDPSNEKVWEELLMISSEFSDWDQMQKDSEKALEYFPNKSVFLYFFATASLQNGANEEAIYAFEKIKKAESANKGLLLRAFLGLGEAYHRDGQYSKSDENFRAALNESPGNPLVMNNYAYFLSLRHERLDEATKMVLQALENEPENGAFQDTYGWILYLQGKYNEAEQWIGKAVSRGGGAEVLEHYGDTWDKLGDRAKAHDFWQKAIDKGAKFDLSQKLIQGAK